MKYTQNFIKLYCNIKSAFTNTLYEEITDDDMFNMYILDVSLQEYFGIRPYEEENEQLNSNN